MVKTLTDRFVAGVRPRGRNTNVFDTRTRGLALLVGARTKVWYFVYRNGGASQWLRLGEYPALKLAEARKRVNEERAHLDQGVDPVAERRKPPAEPEPPPAAFTFADFVPVFIAFQKRRIDTWRDDQNKITRYLLPAWGTLPLREIKRPHIHELLDGIAGQGLTTGVNRVQALISRMFTVALDRSLIDAHPAARMIKRFDEQPRTRVLTDGEIRALWTGLDAHPGVAGDAMRLRLLLGQRGDEIAGLLWSELDLEAALWSLPGTRTKNGRPHVVPLPAQALAVLTRRRAEASEDEPRVFPAFTLQGDAQKALGTLHGQAYTWKDLRRTVATRLAGLGFDETTIGRVLNHARHTITAKHYNQHLYLEESRRALTEWDAELQRIVTNTPRKKTKILPMRAR